MTLFIAILGLAFLILIHEAGHFFTARAVGMKPRRFYLGFPPAVVKIKRNGVEYGIGAIPFGGYVKIPGMFRPAPSDLDVHLGLAVREDPLLVGPVERTKRTLALGDLEAARAGLPELEEAVGTSSLSPAARRAAGRGLTVLSDSLSDDAYWRQRTWKRVAVILAGPATNLLLAIVLLTVLFTVGSVRATRTVGEVLAGRPAASAGLRPGDTIVAIGGRPVKPNEISTQIRASHGKPISVLVRRHGESVVIGPVRATLDQGAYRLGFALRGTGYPVPEAAWQSFRATGIVTKGVVTSFAKLFEKKQRAQLHSAVGITQVSQEALQQGFEDYLWILALVSLSLGLLNLMPLLPFDGGYIAFSLFEGIRGRSVRREVYERVSAVGAVLIVLIMVIGLSNDLGKYVGG